MGVWSRILARLFGARTLDRVGAIVASRPRRSRIEVRVYTLGVGPEGTERAVGLELASASHHSVVPLTIEEAQALTVLLDRAVE